VGTGFEVYESPEDGNRRLQASLDRRFPVLRGIRFRGAVRTRVPEAQIQCEGYLARETAGSTLGMPPLLTAPSNPSLL